MKRIPVLTTLTVLLALWTVSVSAAVPTKINYQGRLLDGSGNNVPDNVYTLAFKIYSVSAGGSPLWSETLPVQVTGGLFTIVLGNSTALDATVFPAGADRYLGVTVNLDPEVFPRTPLVSVAYAIQADEAALAQDLTCSGCISSSHIADGGITAADMGMGSVVGGNGGTIDDGTVNSDDLAPNSVTTSKIVDGSVNAADIAANAVQSTHILDGIISSADLGTDAVSFDEIAANAIGSSEIATNAVVGGLGGDISDGTVTADDLAANSVTSSEIADGGITAADMGFGSVVGGNGGTIDDATVNSDDLAPNSVTTSKIVDGSVNAGDIATNAVQSLHILDGIISAADLGTDAVTFDEIAANAVGSDEISNNAVVGGLGGDVSDETITADDLAVNSVTSSEIADAAVGTSEVASNSLQDVDLLDEAGFRAGPQVSLFTLASGTDMIDSVVLTAPTSGFAIVTACAGVGKSHTSGGGDDLIRLDISTTRASVASPYVRDIRIPTGAATGSYESAVSTTEQFSASTGANVYYFNAQRNLSSNVSGVDFRQVQVIAIFVPTQY